MKKFFLFCAALLCTVAINAADLYIRGVGGNWDAKDEYKFTDNGDGTFTLEKTFDLSGSFKFADAAWGDELNFGSKTKATCSAEGVTIDLVVKGDNISTEGTLQLTKIVVDKNNKKATFYGAGAPAPEITVYTIAGQSALMGSDWNPADAANDMTNMGDGTFQLVKEGVTLAAGDYEYKAAGNHAWGVWECPSSGNNILTIAESGVYTVTFTLTPATLELKATAVKGDTPTPPTPPTPGSNTYYLVGWLNGAAYGIEGDIDNMGDYNLTSGPVVVTFEQMSYVQVKNQDKVIYGTPYVGATESGSTILSTTGTDKIGVPGEVEITFTLTENADGTVTLAYAWGDTPTPSENVYGITVNGTPVLGTKNESPLDPSFEEWQVLEQSLVTGDLVTLYNQNGGATWVVTLDEASVPGIELNATGDAYIITQDGCYNFYIKLKFEADQLYVGSCGDTPTPPTPGEEGFGIILGDGSTVKGWKSEHQVDFLEYMIEADLTTSTTFQIYDFGNQASWTEANVDETSTTNVIINASNVYEVLADGHYTIYLKMYGPENNQVYIGYTEPTSIREATIKAAVKKMVVNGILYIVKDNKAYTAHGF
ncbi:MAG: hypothetical protein KBS40_04670 [Bacteroidales bacterium]|nr:hypothetical protein [Bacteroidales bacterium]